MNKLSLLLLSLMTFSTTLFSQDEAEAMRVIHCSALSQMTAVQNIYVDDNNTKWIASSEGLFEIYSADNAGKKDVADEWVLLRQRGGNYPLEIDLANTELKKMKAVQTFSTETNKNKVNATFFDARKKQLWVGTTESGVYCYKTGTDFKLLKHYDTSNSKLASNRINTIFMDRYQRVWIGTDAGVLMGSEKKWKLYEKEAQIFSIVADKTNVWLMGEAYLWKIDEVNRWMLDDMDERLSRGKIREIAYDSQGKLWVASDIITRFDVLNDKVEVYDASNGFTAKNINCIKVDKDDALWVGTEEGLFLIEREATMTISCVIENELSCTGTTDDASLLVKVFGGTPPYQYDWDASLMGQNPKNVGPGLFTVTVRDSSGIVKTAAAKIVDNRMRVEYVSSSDATGGKNNGKAEIKVTGGVPPYSYKWDSGETKAKAKRLAPGLVMVEIRDKAGCVLNAFQEIGGTPVLASSNTSNSLSIDFDVTNEPTCATDQNASISVSVQGGTPPYTYKWNKAALEGTEIANIGAGEYTVNITDARGKTGKQTIYLEAPEAIKAIAVMDSPVTSDRSRNGIAYVNASGGTGSYKYEWSNGSQKSKIKDLAKGKYTVTVTDQNGCTASAETKITKQINSALASTKKLRKGQVIRLEKLYFQADSTQITDVSLPTLNEIVKFMENNPEINIEIGGHTNSVPPQEYCDRLSTARAKSVAEYLTLKGVSASRVKYRGYGKREPIASNNTTAGRKRNQRVEVKIL